jgi:hypothetical protein
MPYAQGQVPAPVPGRNSNLASGPAEIDLTVSPPRIRGDLLLKQDNEGSCARGTRNPKNILCGGNDYGLVDVPGIDPQDVVRDSGAGVYQSTDGGDTWESTFLPGHILDVPTSGVLKNYKAFADVTVRSGAAGIAYYTGIAFKSVNNTSIGYVATFLELNNSESDRMPFKHLHTVKFDAVVESLFHDPLKVTSFIDKPWSVVLPPQGSATCTITVPRPSGPPLTQVIPDSPILIGYTIFRNLEKHPDLMIAEERIVKVTNCGRNVGGSKLVGLGQRLNGMSLAVSPKPGSKTVVAVWRRFANQLATDTLFAAVSNDHGNSWGLPRVVAHICPFQQASTGMTARVNTWPSAAIDHTGRILVAWSDRLRDSTGACLPAGQSKIVVSTSANGTSWSSPSAVDPGTGSGHQITPSLTYGGGNLLLLWKDLRETKSGYFDDFINEFPLLRAAAGQFDPPPPGAVPGPPFYHHTIELYSKMANVSPSLLWGPSVRVSQYKFGKSPGEATATQKQWEIINLKLFAKGTKVFDSDYADAAFPSFLPPDPTAGRPTWGFDTGQIGHPVFYAVWTSNRDVQRVSQHTDPTGSSPIPYTPPGLTGSSWADPSQTRPECTPGAGDFTRTMDQNLYGSRLSRGLFAYSPGNNKQVTDFQRGYVVTVRNDSAQTKTYQLAIPLQFQTPVGGFVSFSQFPPFGGANAVRLVTVAPKSIASRTVFIVPDSNPATMLNPRTRVRVDVTELVNGVPANDSSSVYLNPDPTAPEIEAPEIEAREIYTPEIEAAEITVHSTAAPEIEAPEIEAPEIEAPEIEAPEIEAKSFQTPEIEAPEIEAPEIEAPEIEAPEIEAQPYTTDVTWPVTNNGNATAGYVIRPTVGGDLGPFHFQLVASRIVLLATSKDCQPASATMNKVSVNLRNANQLVVPGAVISPEDLDNATIWIAPGETVLVTLRVRGPVPFTPQTNPTVLTVTQQAIDTDLLAGGTTVPPSFTSTASPNILFVVQPSDVVTGAVMAPTVQVRVIDNSGASIPGVNVTLSIAEPAGGATLAGTTQSQTNADGTALFGKLIVNGVASNLRLIAAVSVPGVAPATSVPFDVLLAAPGPFEVTNLNDNSQPGSLRWAIEQANQDPDLNTITFNLGPLFPGPPYVISPITPLPSITSSVVIDGFTQPGSVTPPIVIRGLGLEPGNLGASGLHLAGGSSVIRGLVIQGFPGPGITVSSSGNVIEQNYIGTDAAGLVAVGNAQGIALGSSATQNVIGGDDPARRNVIGGNTEYGLLIEGSGNIVRGNVIGRMPVIGGFIGAANGTGTADAGVILLGGAAGNFIGGTDAVPVGNWIGSNNGPGIALSGGGIAGVGPAGSGNTFGRNQIADNLGLGIDIGVDGITQNDTGDPPNIPPDQDAGPNDVQNFPEASGTAQPTFTLVTGSLISTPNQTYRIEFFVSDACDASGFGEGITFLGSTTIELDSSGIREFALDLPPTAAGQGLTATATNAAGSTSEYSACTIVQTPEPTPIGSAALELGSRMAVRAPLSLRW